MNHLSSCSFQGSWCLPDCIKINNNMTQKPRGGKKRPTLKDQLIEAQHELALAKERTTRKDFYQGFAWGGATAVVIYLIARIAF